MYTYTLESTAERRMRRNNDIKKLFQQLTIEENMSFMEAYEAVGYDFYLSADHVQKILRSINKSRQNAEWIFLQKLYLCSGFPINRLAPAIIFKPVKRPQTRSNDIKPFNHYDNHIQDTNLDHYKALHQMYTQLNDDLKELRADMKRTGEKLAKAHPNSESIKFGFTIAVMEAAGEKEKAIKEK